MKRGWIVLIFVVVIVGAGLAIYFGTRDRGPEELIQVSLRHDWLPQAQFAGSYVAQDKGYFEDAGLDMTVNPGGVDLNPIRLVASGSDTFGMANADQLLVARAQGLPLMAIAALFQQNPVVFITLADSGIETPQDFVGRTVGVKVGTSPDILYQSLMSSQGIDRSQIQEIPVQYDMANFFSGNVEVWPAYIINEAMIARNEGFEINVINPFDYGVFDYAGVIFTTEKYLEENREIVLAFLEALLQGWKDSINDPEMAVSTLIRMNDGLNERHETEMMQAVIELVIEGVGNRTGWMEEAKWESTYEMLDSQGLLEESFPVTDSFTLDLVEEIY